MENSNNVIREFEFNGKKFKVLKPTAYILREAKYRYTKVFTESIRSGYFTKKKMDMVLKETHYNVIQEHVNKRAEILQTYAETQEALNKTSKPEEIEYLAELLTIYRQSLVQEDMSMNNIYSNTAEQLSEDERINYLTANMVVELDGTKVWESDEAYFSDSNYEFVEFCKYQIICWEYQLDPNWKDGLPEELARKRATDIRLLEEESKKEIKAPLKKESKKKIKAKPKKIAKAQQAEQVI